MDEKFGMIDEVPFQSEDGSYMEDEQPETDMDAENRLQKINGWEAYRKKWLDFYAKKIAEVNDRADRNIAWHKYHLARFFRSVPHRSTKTQQTYDLPSCQLVMTKPTDKINKPDANGIQKILLRFAEAHDETFVKRKTVTDLDWTEYKKNLSIIDGQVVDSRTGELVDDVQITHVDPEFVLKFKHDMKGGSEYENDGNPNS